MEEETRGERHCGEEQGGHGGGEKGESELGGDTRERGDAQRERGGTTLEWVPPTLAPFLSRVRDAVENVEADSVLR
jgi:hypothetical protein